MAEYQLVCRHRGCNRRYDGSDGYRLVCDAERDKLHGPALLMPAYEEIRLEVREDLPGIFRYADWLPTGPHILQGDDADFPPPVIYRSFGLGGYFGLTQLYIAFSGYWPERGAFLVTRSFKEFEVAASVSRYLALNTAASYTPLVVASAGNTGNAYSLYATRLNIPLYIVVPEVGLDKMILPVPTVAKVVAVRGDYSDAIGVAKALEKAGLVGDGGVRNVGRRAGMGSVMLHSVLDRRSGTGRLFDHYFQAVGSGSGAIAAFEAVELLLRDGRFGKQATQIHMAQNEPFTPIPDAWEQGSQDLLPADETVVSRRIAAATAQVLTNRHPPYSVAGGLYDTLALSHGKTWRVSNYSLFQAARCFKQTEGIDIGESSAVAIAALEQAVRSGAVRKDDLLLLHLTGGGYELTHTAGQTQPISALRAVPIAVVNPNEAQSVVETIGKVEAIPTDPKWLRRYA